MLFTGDFCWNYRVTVVLRLIRPERVRAQDSQRFSDRAWAAREWEERCVVLESSGLVLSTAARAKDKRNRIMFLVVGRARGSPHPSPDLSEGASHEILPSRFIRPRVTIFSDFTV